MNIINLQLLLWALPLFMCIHVFEEFAFPGGFIPWIAAQHARRLKKTSYYVAVNAAGIVAASILALGNLTAFGYCVFIWLVTFMATNGLSHAIASIQAKKYCPGMVTGVLLFFPLLAASCWKLLSDGLINWQSVALNGVSAFVVGFFFIKVHHHGARTRAEAAKKLNDDMENAKKLFFDYACNTFFMLHDGVWEEYKALRTTPAQEAEWRREYIAFWVGQLSTDDLTAVQKLDDANAGEALADLMKMADQGDDYAKLRYAITIGHLSEKPRELCNAIKMKTSLLFWKKRSNCSTIDEKIRSISADEQRQAMKTAAELLESLLHGAIEVSDKHKAEIYPYMSSLGASTPEEYVLNYAKHKLADVKKGLLQ